MSGRAKRRIFALPSRAVCAWARIQIIQFCAPALQHQRVRTWPCTRTVSYRRTAYRCAPGVGSQLHVLDTAPGEPASSPRSRWTEPGERLAVRCLAESRAESPVVRRWAAPVPRMCRPEPAGRYRRLPAPAPPGPTRSAAQIGPRPAAQARLPVRSRHPVRSARHPGSAGCAAATHVRAASPPPSAVGSPPQLLGQPLCRNHPALATNSNASTARGFGPPSASAWPSLTACTGPRMPNSTTELTHLYATPRTHLRRPPASAGQPVRQVRRRRSPLPQRPRERRRMRQEQTLATTRLQQIRLPVLWIRGPARSATGSEPIMAGSFAPQDR